MTDTNPGAQQPESGHAPGGGEPTPPSPWSPHGHGAVEEPQYASGAAAQPQEAPYVPPQEPPQVLFGSAVGGQPPPYVPPAHTQTYPTPPPSTPPRRSSGLVVRVAVLALLVGGGAGAVGGLLVADRNARTAPSALDTAPPAKQASAPAPSGTVEAVADKLLPSVVQLRTRSGEGSGFVIRQDGLIVTNNHVIAEAAQDGANNTLKVSFQDGQVVDGTVLGRDSSSDVAVVQAKGVSGKTPVALGRSDDLKTGQSVVAIGSPFDLSGTVTSGIVSSLHRPTSAGGDETGQATVLDAIQTDAAINPGNSGGPLVNMSGQVIGINSAIYSPNGGGGGRGQQQGGSVGIGFAIPIDQARRTADEIVKTGKATQTVLGVSVQTPQTGTAGAQVSQVTGGGAAAQAGIQVGDVVTKMDDRRIDTSDALVAAVRSKAPGDKVTLTIGNGTRTVQVTLGGQPAPTN
ncbi:S1C family serine protease [Actinocrispum wychmicini]|uniref:Putative serine protease PepD n=1 Tax=Actinocrispum wychmicini TaxID=1213861 RepID=A0A4R2JI01_9PSEU|nr:trypsin-like peptidase domain-containing protein [Actinocrispum wychmicini]TCO58357.1 putative serine protease PepD [Actinocrispum wychmicini]